MLKEKREKTNRQFTILGILILYILLNMYTFNLVSSNLPFYEKHYVVIKYLITFILISLPYVLFQIPIFFTDIKKYYYRLNMGLVVLPLLFTLIGLGLDLERIIDPSLICTSLANNDDLILFVVITMLMIGGNYFNMKYKDVSKIMICLSFINLVYYFLYLGDYFFSLENNAEKYWGVGLILLFESFISQILVHLNK